MGVDVARIDLDSPRRGCRRCRGIVVLQQTREAGVRRRPRGVGLQRRLKRFQGLGRVVLVEEQASPRGLDRRRITSGTFGVAIEGVGVARPIERLGGATRAEQRVGIRRTRALFEDAGQQRLGIARAADPPIEERELERGLAGRVARRHRLELRLGFPILASFDAELCEHDDGVGVRGAARRGQLLRFASLSVRDRGRRGSRECRLRGGLRVEVRWMDGRPGQPETNREEDDDQRSHRHRPATVRARISHGIRSIIVHGFRRDRRRA